METRRIISLVTAAVLVLLCMSCSDDADGQSWQFDEPPPESTVNQGLCGDMPGSEIDGPVVAQVDEEQWRVRYPVFEQGCGVYQLDAYIGPSHDGDLGAEYETRVCNRCDQPQKLVFLDDYGAIGVEGPTEPLPTPQQPDVRDDVPTLFFQGLPPVRAGASDESCRMISTSGETAGSHSFPSYGGFYRVSLAAGESTELHRMPGYGDSGLVGALEAVADGAEDMRVYWPWMRHRDVHVTGLEAASNSEFCERAVYHGDSMYDRPYADPYRLDAKYVRQTTSVPSLPDDLSDRLRRSDEQQF